VEAVGLDEVRAQLISRAARVLNAAQGLVEVLQGNPHPILGPVITGLDAREQIVASILALLIEVGYLRAEARITIDEEL